MRSFRAMPYDKRVYVTACPAEFVKKYNAYTDAGDDQAKLEDLDGCLGYTAHTMKKGPSAKPLFIVYIRPHSPASVVWHEALHMTHFLMHYAGMPIDYESTELQAYTLEMIGKGIEKALQTATPKKIRQPKKT